MLGLPGVGEERGENVQTGLVTVDPEGREDPYDVGGDVERSEADEHWVGDIGKSC